MMKRLPCKSGYEGFLNEIDYILLQKVMPDLIKNADYWTEEELKMSFISMIRIKARKHI